MPSMTSIVTPEHIPRCPEHKYLTNPSVRDGASHRDKIDCWNYKKDSKAKDYDHASAFNSVFSTTHHHDRLEVGAHMLHGRMCDWCRTLALSKNLGFYCEWLPASFRARSWVLLCDLGSRKIALPPLSLFIIVDGAMGGDRSSDGNVHDARPLSIFQCCAIGCRPACKLPALAVSPTCNNP